MLLLSLLELQRLPIRLRQPDRRGKRQRPDEDAGDDEPFGERESERPLDALVQRDQQGHRAAHEVHKASILPQISVM